MYSCDRLCQPVLLWLNSPYHPWNVLIRSMDHILPSPIFYNRLFIAVDIETMSLRHPISLPRPIPRKWFKVKKIQRYNSTWNASLKTVQPSRLKSETIPLIISFLYKFYGYFLLVDAIFFNVGWLERSLILSLGDFDCGGPQEKPVLNRPKSKIATNQRIHCDTNSKKKKKKKIVERLGFFPSLYTIFWM